MAILSSIRPTIVTLALFTALFGVAYPGISTVIGKTMFPDESEGSLIIGKNGEVLGSKLIGQNFTAPKYFWGRPSAANHNAAASSGSNLGTANPVLIEAVQARVTALKVADPTNTNPVPVDLVTASGSGLDPEISLAAAEYQVKRVAAARGLPESKIREVLQHFTSSRQLGIMGEPRVNVLQVNLALDGKV